MCFNVTSLTQGFKVVRVKCEGVHIIQTPCFALNRYNVVDFSSGRCTPVHFARLAKGVQR